MYSIDDECTALMHFYRWQHSTYLCKAFHVLATSSSVPNSPLPPPLVWGLGRRAALR